MFCYEQFLLLTSEWKDKICNWNQNPQAPTSVQFHVQNVVSSTSQWAFQSPRLLEHEGSEGGQCCGLMSWTPKGAMGGKVCSLVFSTRLFNK